jgi:hypothetical protein
MQNLIANFSDECGEFSDSVTNGYFLENFILTDYSDKILKREGSR